MEEICSSHEGQEVKTGKGRARFPIYPARA
jgi:hypothetical protein